MDQFKVSYLAARARPEEYESRPRRDGLFLGLLPRVDYRIMTTKVVSAPTARQAVSLAFPTLRTWEWRFLRVEGPYAKAEHPEGNRIEVVPYYG